jgi:hypothetical protein
MKNINLNNKHEVRQLGLTLQQALEAVGKEYGLNITYDGGTLLGSTECRLKIRIRKTVKTEADHNDVKQLMKSYGVDFYYNKQFTARGKGGRTETFIVTGYDPGCYKNPFKLERPNGGPGAKCGEGYLKVHLPGAPDKKRNTLTLSNPDDL